MDDNKRNLVWFEAPTMRGLFDAMDTWQTENRKRLQSVSVQHDGGAFCCIALTNPAEVTIVDTHGLPIDSVLRRVPAVKEYEIRCLCTSG